MKLRTLAVLALLGLGAGCSSPVAIMPTAAPAGEVMANRVIRTPALYYFSPELQQAGFLARYPGITCAAFSFPVQLGPALTQTLRTATEAGFSDARPAQGSSPEGGSYFLRFTLEEVNGRLGINEGFLSATMQARVSMVVRVSVYTPDGSEAVRAILNGEGQDESQGGGNCGAGGTALSGAADKALRRLATEYVYKVINTNVLR